jgi:EmrB/QacA subfamily drug resistance transporter
MVEQKLSQRRIWFIMSGVMLSLLLAALDNTVVGTAMPRIIYDLKGMEYYSWPFTAYMLFSASIIPIAGKLSDIYGRKLIDLVGMIVFIIASALCGLSTNMIQLIIFRGFQGLGGGVLISNAFIIVGELFSPRERGKYTGYVASMFGVASVLGPTVGGFITDRLSWRWVFYVNLPLGFFAFFVLLIALPLLKHHEEERRMDLVGVATFLLAVFPLLLAFSGGGKEYPWLSPQILGLFTFSGLMFLLFLSLERRSREPLLPLSLFRNSIFSVSVAASFLASAGLFGGLIFIPLFAQSIMGATATGSGVITTPMMLGMIVAAIATGIVSGRLRRYRAIGLVGFASAFVGMMLLARMGLSTSHGLLMFNVVLVGLGMGMIIPIFNVSTQNAFPLRQLGAVTSALQFFRNMGGTISSAILGSVMLASYDRRLKALSLASLPHEVQGLLKDTRNLRNSTAIERIKSLLPSSLTDQFDKIVMQAKSALAVSILNVFLICVFIFLAGLLVTIFLNEKEVRKGVESHRTKPSTIAGETAKRS